MALSISPGGECGNHHCCLRSHYAVASALLPIAVPVPVAQWPRWLQVPTLPPTAPKWFSRLASRLPCLPGVKTVWEALHRPKDLKT